MSFCVFVGGGDSEGDSGGDAFVVVVVVIVVALDSCVHGVVAPSLQIHPPPRRRVANARRKMSLTFSSNYVVLKFRFHNISRE